MLSLVHQVPHLGQFQQSFGVALIEFLINYGCYYYYYHFDYYMGLNKRSQWDLNENHRWAELAKQTRQQHSSRFPALLLLVASWIGVIRKREDCLSLRNASFCWRWTTSLSFIRHPFFVQNINGRYLYKRTESLVLNTVTFLRQSPRVFLFSFWFCLRH